MPKTVETSARGQIQLVVGELGDVLPYRHQTDRSHRAVGWYVVPTAASNGCACPYCLAAGHGVELFLGYHRRDAIVEAELAARAHAA